MLLTTWISYKQWFNILISVTLLCTFSVHFIASGYFSLSFWQMISYTNSHWKASCRIYKDVWVQIEIKSRFWYINDIQMLSLSHYVPHQIYDHLSWVSVWLFKREWHRRRFYRDQSCEIRVWLYHLRPTKEFFLPRNFNAL